MPMVDYQCSRCGYRFENFYHSDAPKGQPCPSVMDVDGQPVVCDGYAPRISSVPGEYRPVNAQRFDPITVWISNTDPNQFSMPGRADEPVQEGYHAVQITNLRDADAFTRRVNSYELEKAQYMREAHKQHWDERLREQRADRDAKIGSNPRMQALARAIRQRVDAKRDKKYSRPMDPKAHFQVIAYDSSNREGFRDESTGWKERRS